VWKAARGPIPADLQEVIDRTDKEIAHLTTARRAAGDPRKAWSFERLYTMFFSPLHLFLKHAEPARLDVSVVAFISALPTPPGSTAGTLVYGATPWTAPGGRSDVSTP